MSFDLLENGLSFPYGFIWLFSLVIGFFAIFFKDSNSKISLIYLSIFLIVIGGLRERIGNDYDAYEELFRNVWAGYHQTGFELGFVEVIGFFKVFGNVHFVFLFFCFLYVLSIGSLPISYAQRVVTLSFISLTYFWGDIGTIRQTFVISIYYLVLYREARVKVPCLLLLPLIHFSGVAILLFELTRILISKQKKFVVFIYFLMALMLITAFKSVLVTYTIKASLLQDSVASHTINRDISVGWLGCLRLGLVWFTMMIFTPASDRFSRHCSYFSGFCIACFIVAIPYLDFYSVRFLSLTRVAESAMLARTALSLGRRSYFAYILIATILFIRGLMGMNYEPELHFPYHIAIF